MVNPSTSILPSEQEGRVKLCVGGVIEAIVSARDTNASRADDMLGVPAQVLTYF